MCSVARPNLNLFVWNLLSLFYGGRCVCRELRVWICCVIRSSFFCLLDVEFSLVVSSFLGNIYGFQCFKIWSNGLMTWVCPAWKLLFVSSCGRDCFVQKFLCLESGVYLNCCWTSMHALWVCCFISGPCGPVWQCCGYALLSLLKILKSSNCVRDSSWKSLILKSSNCVRYSSWRSLLKNTPWGLFIGNLLAKLS